MFSFNRRPTCTNTKENSQNFFFPTFANLSIFYCGQLCFHNKHSDDIRLKSTCFGASTVLPQSRHPLRGPSAVTVVVCDLVDGILHVKP